MSKIIFLDVDGVLNCTETKARCQGVLGIDDDKVDLLAEIVRATRAKIVLTSSWRYRWYVGAKDEQDELANYLDRKLARKGLHIIDKVCYCGSERGQGIRDWLNNHSGVEQWIVLDDEVFPDYGKYGIKDLGKQNIMPNLIKTDFYDGGLNSDHTKRAIQLLNH